MLELSYQNSTLKGKKIRKIKDTIKGIGEELEERMTMVLNEDPEHYSCLAGKKEGKFLFNLQGPERLIHSKGSSILGWQRKANKLFRIIDMKQFYISLKYTSLK